MKRLTAIMKNCWGFMVRNMKIYEIGTGYTPIPARMGAATEIVVEELVKAFQKQNAETVLLDIQAHDRKENDLPIREVPVPGCFAGTDVQLGVMHKLKRVVYSVALAAKLRQILKKSSEPVLLHFHNQYNLFFFLKLTSPSLRAKAKIAYTVHSYIWPSAWEEIRETVHKRYFQEVFCVQNADYVLVLNDKTAEHFVQQLGVDASRIHKVGNGVNTDIYHILEKEAVDAFKDSIGLSGKKIVFQVGSVCDRKNQLGAVKRLKAILQENPDVLYMYAGGVIDDDYQQEILRFARENGIADQVRYAGELCPGEQLNMYYNAADITVFPSKVESFGLVIIESVSAGTPVLLAEEPLFVLKGGCDIYHSDAEFEQKIKAALQASGKDSDGRREVVQNYSWEKIARDHLAIWAGE